MKRILLLLSLFLVTGVSNAQITFTGIVKDSIGDVLEMASILAINKETKEMASYGFTDAKGRFKLSLNKNATFDVKISYVGMKTQDLVITTKESDITKNITMSFDSLEGFNIVSKMPVTISGDTIIYNADSYQNGTERKLEDILEKLPGVEINDSGQIEVEGKVVEKITVDGKEFFSGDTKLASKNIPSNAVDKIQVLRNFGDVNQLKGVQNNQDRVAINIKLKEGKKNFWFGDVVAGGGASPSESLYLFQPKLFYYTPKYTLNVIGDVNNLGDVVLSRRDIRGFNGGFRSQSPSNGTNINLGSAGIGFLTAGARNSNRIETRLSALNLSYSPSKKLDLSGFLIFSNNSNGRERVNTIDYVDPNTPDDTVINRTDQTSNTGLAKFGAIYKKDINNQMNYNLIGRFSNEFRNANVNSLVLSDISENERATPFTINQDLSYFYTLNENNIFALEVKHLLQDEDPFYVASLENDPNNNDDVDNDGFDDAAETLGLDRSNFFYTLEQDRRVKSNQLDAKLDYYHILNTKSNLNFVAGTILSRQNFNSRFFQILDNGSELNPNPIIPGITNDPRTINDTEYNFRDIYAGLRYRLKSGIFTFTPGFTAHAYSAKNMQYGNESFVDEFIKFLPEFEVIAQIKNSETLTFRYRQQVNFTDVVQIARGIVANNYNSFFAGNAELINASSHSLNLFYRNFNLFNGTNIIASVNYNQTIDQVNRNTIFEPGSVVASSTSINSPFNNENFSSFASYSKTFKKIRASIGGNFNYNKSYQFINAPLNPTPEDANVNENIIRGLNTRINSNFRKAPNFGIRYRVTFTDQSNTARAQDVQNVTHSPSLDFDAYIWNSLTIRSDFSFNEVRQNGTVTNTFNLWNATLAYRKDRDAKWEYEIVGNNLTGTSSTVNVNQNVFSFSINETFILPRLISLRVRYSL